MKIAPDPISDFEKLRFRAAPFPIRVHDEVVTALETHPKERGKRLRLVLQL